LAVSAPVSRMTGENARAIGGRLRDEAALLRAA
jgi:DNA-binding IclR family transcriptional regulator